MVRLEEASEADLLAQSAELRRRYDDFKARALSLDMTRGKPCAPQLDLSNALLGSVAAADVKDADGVDTRNYGGLEGIGEARRLFAAYFDVAAEEVLVGGNSSLALMYNTIAQAMARGVPGSSGPWRDAKPKFLCPVPGYDRHFTICESLGIEMINVPLGDDGPDVAAIGRLTSADASIKGMWCVPRYSNPTGITYSDAVVDGLAALPAAADFRVFWDDAYAVHDLDDSPQPLKNFLAACKAAGNPDRAYVFASTSKITFPGAGVAAMAASRANLADQLKGLFAQTIGPDKINQLRHVRFLRDMAHIREHMRRHAEILRPKFDLVLAILERELGDLGVATWSKPRGGYFISLDTPPGCASRVVELAAAAGVKLTQAGATFPYGRDPENRNLRIAPTLPSLDEIGQAMELFCICVQIAAIDQQLHRRAAS